jgi:hypothetical protein
MPLTFNGGSPREFPVHPPCRAINNHFGDASSRGGLLTQCIPPGGPRARYDRLALDGRLEEATAERTSRPVASKECGTCNASMERGEGVPIVTPVHHRSHNVTEGSLRRWYGSPHDGMQSSIKLDITDLGRSLLHDLGICDAIPITRSR